ncbi:hypothetical protein BDY21DRAFT_329959 [Lineolata rhizophorae]|uniref:Uncharacterized protein n=1 Tax=Lineolata rhizophorae TaxID=578093 RepID=A0A6A6PDL1_9PEZI|nr:hypothetical protein BDY21DRAFT_329959 [Lineolata rhizophorae]
MGSPGIRGLTKHGWHPQGKDGQKESWRGDFKGINTVAGWMGKGKPAGAQDALEHQSTPLSSLRDPSSFGPPPKHTHYHGASAAAASPTSPVTRSGIASPSSRPLGSAIPSEEITAQQQRLEAEQRAEEEAERPPAGPYRADTTGLSTAGLPSPPVRRATGAGGVPSPTSSTPVGGHRAPTGQSTGIVGSAQGAGPKPSLPPRLPPRQTSHPDLHTPAPPPTYGESQRAHEQAQQHPQGSTAAGYLNQGALNRLGRAGVSVPGLGIGQQGAAGAKSPPPPPLPTRRESSSSSAGTGGAQSPVARTGHAGQLGELQSRFARLGSGSSAGAGAGGGGSTSASVGGTPTGGTSLAQKQDALRTARSLHAGNTQDVSASDVRGAADVARNFHERHGEQVSRGWKAAGALGQKYGGAVGGSSSSSAAPSPQSPTSPGLGAAAGKKKAPPPPPPPKKKGLEGVGTGETAASEGASPPPVPLASKPKWA